MSKVVRGWRIESCERWDGQQDSLYFLTRMGGECWRPAKGGYIKSIEEAKRLAQRLRRCPKCKQWRLNMGQHKGSLNCHLETARQRHPKGWVPVYGEHLRQVRRSPVPQQWHVSGVKHGFKGPNPTLSSPTMAVFGLYVPEWVVAILNDDLGNLLHTCTNGPSADVKAARTMMKLEGKRVECDIPY